MNPVVTLIQPAITSPLIYPDNLTSTALQDWQLGGIGLSDPSQGLEYQAWELNVLGQTINTAVYLSAPNTPATQIFALANLTWARLAFDQNMKPVISYVAGGQAGFYWWDPTIPGITFTNLPSTANNPCVTMDDKRALSTLLGSNDIVMTYVNNTNLCYRLQRERYQTEHIWYTNITNVISNPYVNKIGMNQNYRLQLDIHGALYQ